ncbi:6-phosphogluconolactonase [Ruania alba]|uniref:Glucosamine-6-phosphate deaminase n=1 Tax=Ruania alba TaxID=648782 RepID=A0A1H5MDK1_9MICO|nr:6-phosphogluconolactonase [Ruania alba]SEE86538.1 glucosamine-6-phosphate deaminase [Ruania alba]
MPVTDELEPRVIMGATVEETARAAAQHAAAAIIGAIQDHGSARVVFASAPSQEAMLAELSRDERIDWSKVSSFHMDEYLDLAMDRPQAFGQWLADRLPLTALPGFERIRADAHDSAAEIARYSALLTRAPVDVTCLGVGVNGHIAFNEPEIADFADPGWVREVTLDLVSRQQQVDDGLFADVSEVPSRALTLTVPALASAATMVCTVVGSQKAPAVARALTGPVEPACPASRLQEHPGARWFLDRDAASELDTHPDGLPAASSTP